MWRFLLTLETAGCLLLAAACGSSSGEVPATSPGSPGLADAPPQQATFTAVRNNIFQPRCASCHGGENAQAGINLDSYDSLMASNSAQGHDIVVPGNPDGSHLYDVLRDGRMPPSGPPLSNAELATVRTWILNGAKND